MKQPSTLIDPTTKNTRTNLYNDTSASSDAPSVSDETLRFLMHYARIRTASMES